MSKYFLLFSFLLTACLQPVEQREVGSDAQSTALPTKIVQQAKQSYGQAEPHQEWTADFVIMPSQIKLQCTVTAKTLYIRSNPGTLNKPIGFLRQGTILTVHEWDRQGRGWVMIAPAEWINADFCEVKP